MAPADGARRAGLGWVILAAALAVPGFLFYNWWSHLKSEHDRGVAAKARSRAAEGSVFQTQPASLARPAVGVSTAAASAPPAPPPPGPPPGRLPAAPRAPRG
ncbi:MAG: hypothetical protein ACHQ51_15895, partial [Elusimicrobiota bacterium]